ncbi:MAG: hypothetical protein IK013_01850 [Bacteroidales bacterium]|nr:hypothetical protein [Bacteroidales bacterium]
MENTTTDIANIDWKEVLASVRETTKQMKETGLRMKETDRRMKETDRQQRKTEREIEELSKHVKQLSKMYTSNWRKLIEALAKPACLKLFKDLGIGITQVYQEARKGEFPDGSMEVDVILCNTTVAVVVEVKTTCKVEDVDYFLEQMEHFKTAFHPFANYTVYPAVAAIKYDGDSDKYAFRKGLFVLKSAGKDIFTLKAPKDRKVY